MKKTLIASFLLFTNFILSQSIISGQVIDGEFNDPLPFANVLITLSDGSNIGGTSTDFDGSYIFEVQPGIYFLEFSFVGYDTKKITEINVGENEEVIVNSILLPASNALEEVIVTTTARQNTEAAVLSLSLIHI